MAERFDFNLDPVTFITVGAHGPPGERTFYLQAAQRRQVVSLVIEKEHAVGLSINLLRLIQELEAHDPDLVTDLNPTQGNMALIEPVETTFRVDNIGIGVDEDRHRVIVIAGELVDEASRPRRARFVATYQQILHLAHRAADVVQQGRPTCLLCGEPIAADGHFCPPRNGHPRPSG